MGESGPQIILMSLLRYSMMLFLHILIIFLPSLLMNKEIKEFSKRPKVIYWNLK